jgi:hypothetical protein
MVKNSIRSVPLGLLFNIFLGEKRMNLTKWEYQITLHELPPQSKEEGIIECDQAGQCFVHDAFQGGVGWLEDLFRAKGREGWELVQFGYHNRELLCIWKKRIGVREKV